MHPKTTPAFIITAAIVCCFCAFSLNAAELPQNIDTALSLIIKTAVLIEEEKPEPVPNTAHVEGCRFTKPIPDIADDDTSFDSFFENSVFCGDSLMQGFELYCQYMGNGFLNNPVFLASKSFSLKEALRPVTESSRHPYYQGQKMLVEEAIAAANAKRAFLLFGTNDMVGLTPEETKKEYNDLIYRIHKLSPDTKIYIIGATYIYASAQKPGFTNENLRIFNDSMYKYCQGIDYLEFINIGDRLIGADDGLKDEYCSDNYVHMTTEGYRIWTKVLRAYADYFLTIENTAD
ncbi:MAG: GDSL-type esterase/lipase family protein [Clostridiales bacterium]|nr:GDSL-type esterase/lipase family protein [Clostridiales bacterium]